MSDVHVYEDDEIVDEKDHKLFLEFAHCLNRTSIACRNMVETWNIFAADYRNMAQEIKNLKNKIIELEQIQFDQHVEADLKD